MIATIVADRAAHPIRTNEIVSQTIDHLEEDRLLGPPIKNHRIAVPINNTSNPPVDSTMHLHGNIRVVRSEAEVVRRPATTAKSNNRISNNINNRKKLILFLLKLFKIFVSLRSSTSGSSRRERSRSRDRNVRKERSRERETSKVLVVKPKEETTEVETFDLTSGGDKEEEQRRLELEMTKRRERIERWRAERKRKEMEHKKLDLKPVTNTKKWSLENESDDDEDSDSVKIVEPIEDEDDDVMEVVDDEEVVEEKKKEDEEVVVVPVEDDEDEIDPLDAFMQEVNKEVRKVNKIANPHNKIGSGAGDVLVVTGVSKKKATSSKKGEMMEQNQDGLEYSSEEEQEDIKDTAANLANKHKKELAKIDHSGVEYQPFRKNFYCEVPELTKLTAEEVTAYKVELEGIQVKGKGCPRPIKTWAHCGVSKKEMEVLKKMAFEKPTPIQCQAIPAVMSGRDLIGIAKTGSGKTLAFILPMFRHILDQPDLEEGDGPVAIIMTPTRELCMQIGKDIRKFSKSLGLRAVCVYGGTGNSLFLKSNLF